MFSVTNHVSGWLVDSGAEHSVCVLLLFDEPLQLFMLLLGVNGVQIG